MKVLIPSKGRPHIISTHLLFKDMPDIDWKVVVHNEEEESYYQLNSTIPRDRIVVSGMPFNIAMQRNWIQDNLLEKGEWYLALDDNLKWFTGINDPELYAQEKLDVKADKTKNWNKIFKEKIAPKRFIEICKEMIEIGDRIGAYNLGFATNGNFFFREKKYRTVGYVISKFCIRKHVGLRFNEEAFSMEDYAYTAENLLHYGKVLINNYVYREAQHYQEGGIGSAEYRIPLKEKHANMLLEQYPELFRVNYKKYDGKPVGKDLIVRFHSEKQIEKWRREIMKIKI